MDCTGLQRCSPEDKAGIDLRRAKMQIGDERTQQEQEEGRGLKVLPMRDFEVARLQALFTQAVREQRWKEALELHLTLIYLLFCTNAEFEAWVENEYS
jgi:hypothetical protein